jgi:hypothetical protein
VVAREGLDSQMYPLVSLQVVISVEALWTLVTLEWTIVGRRLLVRGVTEVMRHRCGVATVETCHHARMYADQR